MFRSRPLRNVRSVIKTLKTLCLCVFMCVGFALTWPAVSLAQADLDSVPDLPVSTAPAPLLLEVRLNGRETGLVGFFYVDAERLYMPANQYAELGLILDEAFVTGEDRRVYLDAVPGLKWQINTAAQSIDLSVPFEAMTPVRASVSSRLPRVESRSDWGVLLGYSLFGQWGGGEANPLYSRSVSGNYEVRLFSPHFTASSTGFVTHNAGNETRNIRLDTHIDFDNPDKVWRLRVGDSYSAGPSWVQPVRFGGIQWQSHYGLRPDLITTPVPLLSENLAVPSTVDVFINGVQRYSQAAESGVLQLTDLPVVTGTNSVRVVVTDPLGRRSENTLPLYGSTRLLARGLSTWSVQAGVNRRNFLIDNFNYAGGFASGSLSHGLSDSVTVTGYGAAAEGYVSVSGGVAFTLSDWAMIDAAIAYSDSHSDSGAGAGWSWHGGIERTTRNFSLAASYMRSSSGYRDLSGHFGFTPVVERAVVSAGVNMGRNRSATFAYAYQRGLNQRGVGVVSATYNRDLYRNRLHLSATAFANTERTSGPNSVPREWGGMLLLAFPLGTHASGYAERSWRNEEASDTLHLNGHALNQNLHWRAEVGNDELRENYAEVDWRAAHADVRLRAGETAGQFGGNIEVAQSIVFMGNQVFVAGRIEDGFTVVEVENSANVKVALENREVGRTNAKGRLFVPQLVSYAPNTVSIDPLDLPLDASLARTTARVSPRAGAGLITRFEVKRERTARVYVTFEDASFPPPGALVRLKGHAQDHLLGYDGEIYLRGVQMGENVLDISWPDTSQQAGSCRVVFTVEALDDSLPQLGPFICVR